MQLMVEDAHPKAAMQNLLFCRMGKAVALVSFLGTDACSQSVRCKCDRQKFKCNRGHSCGIDNWGFAKFMWWCGSAIVAAAQYAHP